MNLNKRFFLITTMVVVILVAIAFGPAYKRTVRADNAKSPHATVILTCYGVSTGEPLVAFADTSDSEVTLPAASSDCAIGIQSIESQGFVLLPAVATPEEGRLTWTLVRIP